MSLTSSRSTHGSSKLQFGVLSSVSLGIARLRSSSKKKIPEPLRRAITDCLSDANHSGASASSTVFFEASRTLRVCNNCFSSDSRGSLLVVQRDNLAPKSNLLSCFVLLGLNVIMEVFLFGKFVFEYWFLVGLSCCLFNNRSSVWSAYWTYDCRERTQVTKLVLSHSVQIVSFMLFFLFLLGLIITNFFCCISSIHL